MKELNVFQQKTAENAKKKLEEIEKLKPILEAAIEGKVIKFDVVFHGYSSKAELDFSYPASKYTIEKEKVKVYTCTYSHALFGTYTLGSSDKSQYDLYIKEIVGYKHCKILKETIEEIEVN